MSTIADTIEAIRKSEPKRHFYGPITVIDEWNRTRAKLMLALDALEKADDALIRLQCERFGKEVIAIAQIVKREVDDKLKALEELSPTKHLEVCEICGRQVDDNERLCGPCEKKEELK